MFFRIIYSRRRLGEHRNLFQNIFYISVYTVFLVRYFYVFYNSHEKLGKHRSLFQNFSYISENFVFSVRHFFVFYYSNERHSKLGSLFFHLYLVFLIGSEGFMKCLYNILMKKLLKKTYYCNSQRFKKLK
jgi:hypothetical protein